MRELGLGFTGLTPTGLTVTPVKGGETGKTGLEGVSAVSKAVSETDETGSRQGSAEGETPTDEYAAMMRQLDHLK